jgi:cation diffusion facilitator family transporter
LAAGIKIYYGHSSASLAFVADGIHSLFDAAATLIGIVSITLSAKPPDEGHPYGHQKFESVSTIALGLMLLSASYEVGSMAIERLGHPEMPTYTFWGFVVLAGIMVINLSVSRFEMNRARALSSRYLAADALHNQSDFLISCAVLLSLLSVSLHLPYVDAGASLAITLYLALISFKMIWMNLRPLVDYRVLDPEKVEEIVSSTEGVLHCHNIRSRGEDGHHFLDLNIHLHGHITLERAHEITHNVEERLKAAFPGLVDVVIHTEPHNHPPCTKG